MDDRVTKRLSPYKKLSHHSQVLEAKHLWRKKMEKKYPLLPILFVYLHFPFWDIQILLDVQNFPLQVIISTFKILGKTLKKN